ncbi:unnamed protein product [Thelazia callipaeda]|uniref:Uncharacterized protein n=1 Tax=Thelazia callipaeda TaxID=103827 RepID=A0A3P7L9U4_THECL|nr:unnamed protein product [Thelazia callipaeda]
MITPVLPPSQLTEGTAQSTSIPTAPLIISDVTIASTKEQIESTKTTIVAAKNHVPVQQTPVNGEFYESTHTFLSTVSTAHQNTFASFTTVSTAIIIPSNFFPKNDISESNLHTISKANGADSSQTIEEDNDSFLFFWPTLSPIRTQTIGSYFSGMKTSSTIATGFTRMVPGTYHNSDTRSGNSNTENTVKIYQPNSKYDNSFINHEPTTAMKLPSEIIYEPNQLTYLKDSFNFSPDINDPYHSKEIMKSGFYDNQNFEQNHLKLADSNLKCVNCLSTIMPGNTAPAPFPPHISFTSTVPAPVVPHALTKIMQISNKLTNNISIRQSNGNYFEDLWNDIAEPPALIVNNNVEDTRSKTITTASSTTTITSNNLLSSPLTSRPATSTSYTLVTQPITISVEEERKTHTIHTTHASKSIASVISRKTSTISSLAENEAFATEEKGIKRLGRPEVENWGGLQLKYKPQRVLTTSTTASSTLRHRIRTTLISHTIYAVRPTTPMGGLVTSSAKTPTGPTDFPRTALISIASLSVIIIIAIVVFCVFRCRQSGPSTDQYPMVCNGKQSGYAPIPAEMSPQMMHESSTPHTGPFFQNRVNQLNGYQPIKGAVIPSGSTSAGNIKGNGATSSNNRKKEFKEWYV